MVDVAIGEPAVETASPAPGPRRPTRARRRDPVDYAPWLLVAFAVGFTAWMLRPELRALPYPNDASVHDAISRFAAQRIRAGDSPFTGWLPYFGLGSPQFTQYQVLSHVLNSLLSLVFGDSSFRWVNYLLICTWPVSVYSGSRLLGLDRWQAAAAALVSPTMVNIEGYGFEWGSFIWLGSGMWSMLWALWLLPIALGLAWRAVARGERIALAAFVVGLTCALHFLTGYLVLLSLGVFAIVRFREFLRRILRGAIVGVGGLLIFAFVFVPTITGLDYVNQNAYQTGTFWVDSYGAGKLFGWLVRGEIFDSGRFPIVSLLVLCGAVVCAVRSRRDETARVALGLMILSLLLYSGRTVVGPVMDRLPGGTQILLHRYIIGVHFAGMLLAGIGLVWACRTLPRLVRPLTADRHPGWAVVAVVLTLVLALVALLPAFRSRDNYADAERFWTDVQSTADDLEGRDVTALLDIVKNRHDGRVYAGASNNWGAQVKVGEVPLYQLPPQHDTDSIGFYLRTDSLSSNIETNFNDTNPAHYDLFNVKYVLLPTSRRPSVPATVLDTQGAYTLWQVATSGYLEVVDTTEPIAATRTDMAAVMAPYLSSPAVGQHRHPLVAFGGRGVTETPSTTSSAPDAGPPGDVSWSDVSFRDGRFSGGVHASRDAWVMLKESYSPGWTATVDGEPVKTSMLAPSFVGVPVPAGDHIVAFRYRPNTSYPALLALGALVLLALVFGPVLMRRYRRNAARGSRTRSGTSAPLAG